MPDHRYFEVERTALTIPRRGALAIYCSDTPRRDPETGTTTFSLRAPLLLIPDEMFEDAQEIAEKVARILNDHAGEFYSSAKGGDDAEG